MSDWTREHETELLRKVSEGDTQSIARIYDRYSSPLFSLARRMLGSRSDAEEVVQDVFATVFRQAADYDPSQSKLFTWMTAITRNRCVDRLRARNSRIAQGEVVSQNPGESFESAPKASSPEEERGDQIAIRNEEARNMRETLMDLPIEQREVLELAFLSGWTHSEIAERKAISLGTVKARIRYGLEKLRNRIERE